MRIVNAEEFLKLKDGTLFSMFEDMKFWEFYIKGFSFGSEYEWSRVLTQIADEDTEFFADKLTNFEGKSLKLEFNYWRRSTIDEKEKFAIYEKEDIQELIALLQSITW